MPELERDTPFRAGGVLPPGHPAAFEGIYRGSDEIVDAIRRGGAGAICSPRMTGKTTQLGYALARERSRRPIACVTVDVPRLAEPIDLEGLRELLGEASETDKTHSIERVLTTGRRFQGKRSKVLVVGGAENLAENALKWLLGNLRDMRAGSTPAGAGTVLVDGAFAVDTLTVGPNSDYPLPQTFPREFTRDEQLRFVAERLKGTRCRLSEGGSEALWELTAGDKFFTQLICERWWRERGSHGKEGSRLSLARSDVEAVVSSYASEPLSETFRRLFLGAAWRVVEFGFPNGSLGGVLRRIGGRWEGLAVPVRAALYDGGAVRRVSEDEVALRAPLLLIVLGAAQERMRRVEESLDTHLPPVGVASGRREELKRITRQITQAAFCGRLKVLHLGIAKAREQGGVSVEAVTQDGDAYKAVWELELDRKAHGQAWAILWTEEVDEMSRLSHLHIIPVAHHSEIKTDAR